MSDGILALRVGTSGACVHARTADRRERQDGAAAGQSRPAGPGNFHADVNFNFNFNVDFDADDDTNRGHPDTNPDGVLYSDCFSHANGSWGALRYSDRHSHSDPVSVAHGDPVPYPDADQHRHHFADGHADAHAYHTYNDRDAVTNLDQHPDRHANAHTAARD